MIIDNEPIVLKAIARVLRDRCIVETATSGAEALARIRRGERYALILSDVVMPDLDGLALVAALESEAPELLATVVLMSGSLHWPGIRERIERTGLPLLQKPFSRAALFAMISRHLPSVAAAR